MHTHRLHCLQKCKLGRGKTGTAACQPCPALLCTALPDPARLPNSNAGHTQVEESAREGRPMADSPVLRVVRNHLMKVGVMGVAGGVEGGGREVGWRNT